MTANYNNCCIAILNLNKKFATLYTHIFQPLIYSQSIARYFFEFSLRNFYLILKKINII